MINRPKYLNELIKNMNNNFPKVITGIRRCGKSYLLKDIFANYLLSIGVPDENIIKIDLDNVANYNYCDPIYLDEYVRSLCKNKGQCYVIIDEIQNVVTIENPIFNDGKHIKAKKNSENTISFVNTILGLSQEKNIDLYITGSNSKMLSTDIITEFRDKGTNIHINPLSFEEFYNYKNIDENKALFEYMQYGGMPLAVLKDIDDRKKYLISLFNTTYFKDIFEHNKINKTETLDELCNIISTSTGQLINTTKISNTIKSKKNEDIDKQTIEKFLNYFADSFLIRQAKRYDLKGKSEIGALKKYYFVDTGLRNARINFAYFDEGQLLENIVYNELLYNDYTVNVGTFDTVEKNKNGTSIRKTNEVDFYAVKGNRKYYIQVCSDISNESTKEREIRPYFMLNDQVQKIIVINKPIDETRDINDFTIIGICDFLLRFIK